MGLRNKKQEIAEELARKASAVGSVGAEDATDEASAVDLANELKEKFNALLQALSNGKDF